MTATTTTTIRGVSIFSRQRRRKADLFDIALSPEGIEIRRPGRGAQHMTVGADLAVGDPGEAGLRRADPARRRLGHPAAWSRAGPSTTSRPSCGRRPPATSGPTAGCRRRAHAEAAELDAGSPASEAGPPARGGTRARYPAPPDVGATGPARGVRRPGMDGRGHRRCCSLLAAAVTLVLLQSAGVISWGFLGPVA